MIKLVKKTVKIFVVANVIGYTTYKLRLDEKLIRAIEPGFKELVAALKDKKVTE